MNKKSTISILLLIAATFFVLTAFEKDGKRPIEIIQNDYENGLNDFQNKINSLLLAAQKISDQPSTIQDLKETFKETRYAYKKIEYLFAYLEVEGAKYLINGAPLPKLEQNVPEIAIIAPNGLQTIDEIVFGEEPLAEKSHLIQLIEDLQAQFKTLNGIQSSLRFSDRKVFEAMRFQIIRIMSLGITGFDTPASLNALPEAAVSLKAMQKTLNIYLPYIQDDNPSLYKNIHQNLEGAITYLGENDDFDAFDRLLFIRKYLNPLFKDILELHTTLKIETIYEVSDVKHAVNFTAKDIFDKDFLNKYYFIRLNEEQDNEALRELGQILFYDPVLSKNNERACASCHQPKLGFADGRDKSIAFDFKGKIERNAPTLVNSIFADRFFYDLRADEFDLQVEHVVNAHNEFNTSYAEITTKLLQSEDYRSLFNKAFPNQPKDFINASSINTAIVAYTKELIGYNSQLDRYMRKEIEEYPEAARRGFNLFMGKAACGTCHFAPTFSGLVPPDFYENEAEVIGVPATNDTINVKIDPDIGKAGSGRVREIAPYHQFAFKTTTVRNVELTAPYMHNGVYNTLEEVVDFYNRGGGAGMGMDLPHQTLPFDNLNLTTKEQADIVAFMKTLTDDISHLQEVPSELPKFPQEMNINNRKIGGKY